MPEWGTASLPEILWSVIALVSFGFACGIVRTAQRDLRDLPRVIARGKAPGVPFTEEDIARLWRLARQNRRHAVERAGAVLIFLVIGARALVLPPRPATDFDPWAALTGLLFILGSMGLMLGAIQDRRDRAYFDQDGTL